MFPDLCFFVFSFKGVGGVVVVVIVVGGVVVGGARKGRKSSKCSVGAAHGCLAATRSDNAHGAAMRRCTSEHDKPVSARRGIRVPGGQITLGF